MLRRLSTRPVRLTEATAAASVQAQSGAEYYTAVYGDCMWAIAGKYGLTLDGLLALNPQVKNPNILHVATCCV